MEQTEYQQSQVTEFDTIKAINSIKTCQEKLHNMVDSFSYTSQIDKYAVDKNNNKQQEKVLRSLRFIKLAQSLLREAQQELHDIHTLGCIGLGHCGDGQNCLCPCHGPNPYALSS